MVGERPWIERRRVEVGRARVAYRVAGAGPPVVLLHGLGGSGRWWDRNASALAERFHVHVVDLVGFGDSRGGERIGVAAASELLVRWLDRLGLERVSLIGHSMGGRIAADCAADFPARVERLVLASAAIYPASAGRPLRVTGLLRSLRSTSPGFVPILAVDAYRAGPRTLWRAASETLVHCAEDRLTQIATPSLVVWGERDTIVPLATGEQIARLLPRSELVVIPKAGHNPMWDRPDAFNEVVARFLSAAPTSANATAP